MVTDGIFLSSGPCQKPPQWDPTQFDNQLLGRSHRSQDGLDLIQKCLRLHRDILRIPDDYAIAIVPGSCTGAMETAFWNLLGPQPITCWDFGVFSGLWQRDIHHLGLDHVHQKAPLGALPDRVDPGTDLVLTWTETTTGVSIPHGNWIKDCPDRLVFCDAAAAAFCVPLPLSQLDVIAFSWQKGLGGEAAHGVLVLSPRAIKRLSTYTPPWPIPRVFSLKNPKGEPNIPLLYHGNTVNTPSLLCIQDCIMALEWAKAQGGLDFLTKSVSNNYRIINEWVQNHPRWGFLSDEGVRSLCPVLLTHKDHQDWPFYQEVSQNLAKHGVYDVKNHALACPALRFWTGPTIYEKDIARALSYLH